MSHPRLDARPADLLDAGQVSADGREAPLNPAQPGS